MLIIYDNHTVLFPLVGMEVLGVKVLRLLLRFSLHSASCECHYADLCGSELSPGSINDWIVSHCLFVADNVAVYNQQQA